MKNFARLIVLAAVSISATAHADWGKRFECDAQASASPVTKVLIQLPNEIDPSHMNPGAKLEVSLSDGRTFDLDAAVTQYTPMIFGVESQSGYVCQVEQQNGSLAGGCGVLLGSQPMTPMSCKAL